MENDDGEGYLKMTRRPGWGPNRIRPNPNDENERTTIWSNETIYSMFFVSCMHPDYIYYYDKVKGTEKENLWLDAGEELDVIQNASE